MWAEWSAATGGAIDPALERRRLWRLEVRDLPVLDLRDAPTRQALDIDLDQLTASREQAHPFAGRARALGAEGMIVPSAAHVGHWNLVVFPNGFGRIARRTSRAMHPAPPGVRTS